MKDDRLEKEFDEYFKGVSTTNDITADAKKFVKPRRKTMPKFVKFASIAASFVLVFAVALTVILKSDISSSKKGADMSSAPGSSMGDSDDSHKPGSPDYPDGDRDPSSGETEGFKYYTDADLEKRDTSLDDTALPSSLNFIKNFVKSGGTVDNCTASYLDGELILFTAKLNIEVDMNMQVGKRYTHETDIFVEFNKNLIYDELADYYDGEKNDDNGTKYYLTKNGEESKLVILYGGVKYYFNIRSDDENAYAKYLQWIKL